MVVVCVGGDSQWGRTLAKLQQVQEMTPLQKKLGTMAAFLGKLGLGGAVLTFVALSCQV
jgi:magnesium-transporting ATPase (P-type)